MEYNGWRTRRDFRVAPRQLLFEEAACNQNLSRMYIRALGNMHGRSTAKLNAREDRAHIYGDDGEPEDSQAAAVQQSGR